MRDAPFRGDGLEFSEPVEKAFRVKPIVHRDGRRSYWIFSEFGELHRPAVNVLRRFNESTQQTYAFGLVDHLNWLHANRLVVSTVKVEDLRRYMNALTGRGNGVFGVAWRDRPPVGASAGSNVATIVKAFYLESEETDPSVVQWLSGKLATVRRGGRVVTANPLSPKKRSGKPRFLSDEVVTALLEPGVLTSARDSMILRWLVDSGIRVGGLCGLRFTDLHLVRDHPCGQRRDPHVHIVGRDDNPNRARAKSYHEAGVSPDGHVIDGVIRAVSDSMIGTFYTYLLDEFHPIQHLVSHEQVLIHLKGPSAGDALGTSGVRKMLRRACARAGLNSYVTPHAFRHNAAAQLMVATDFNADLVAQEFGWASAEQVTGLYGRAANRESTKFLVQAWEATAPGRMPQDTKEDPQ
ncbi:MAG: tyrosine-type recombinase/integrase [Fimbriimonadaceae bacterium]|nr:tyrosine-type recombinase/integrase [Fimbriimonadaceae bacterium]